MVEERRANIATVYTTRHTPEVMVLPGLKLFGYVHELSSSLMKVDVILQVCVLTA